MNATKLFSTTALTLAVIATGFSAAPAFAQEAPTDQDSPRFERAQKMKRFKKAMQNVNKEITKLDNGIVVTLTTDDSETLEKLQSKSPKERDNVQVVKVNLDNGVQLTITSSDAEVEERLHKKADRFAQKQSITKDVQNTGNGVIVTITSTDEEVVQRLQDREQKQPRNEEIEVSKVDIENGVQITISTDNEDLVERIQNRANKKGFNGRHGRRGMNGEGRFHRGGGDRPTSQLEVEEA